MVTNLIKSSNTFGTKYSCGMCGTCFGAMIHQVGQCTWPAFTPLAKMVNKKCI